MKSKSRGPKGSKAALAATLRPVLLKRPSDMVFVK